jgi:hypothetical protein
MLETENRAYRIADFATIAGVPCPCGTARRAFGDVEEFPGTIRVTEIALDAQLHYHRRLTGVCIMIPPGVRHRALGKMKVLIVVLPKFDPEDEWFD